MARASMTPEEGAQAMVPHIYDASTPRDRVEEDLAIRRLNYPQAAGYMGQVQAILAWSTFDRLAGIRAPTLIIHGETDQLVPPENARILAQHIAGDQFAVSVITVGIVRLEHAQPVFDGVTGRDISLRSRQFFSH